MKKGAVVYIGGPGYSYEHFEPMIDNVSNHFEEIYAGLDIKTPDGKQVEIEFQIELCTPETISATARRVDKEKAKYEVRMTAGLSYHIWLATRVLETDYQVIPWVNKCKIKEKKFRKDGRKALLANYAYYLASYLIILHEISHVVLGHCDFIKDELGMDNLDEFENERNKFPPKVIRIRKAFEAEADRQASEFMSAIFDVSLGESRLGQHITFPSRKHAFEFYTYVITIVCSLLQGLAGRNPNGIHPLPNERQYIMASSISQYLKLYHPSELFISDRIAVIMLEAAKKLGLMDGEDASKVAQSSFSLMFVDDVVRETGIRKYQHIVKKKV